MLEHVRQKVWNPENTTVYIRTLSPEGVKLCGKQLNILEHVHKKE